MSIRAVVSAKHDLRVQFVFPFPYKVIIQVTEYIKLLIWLIHVLQYQWKTRSVSVCTLWVTFLVNNTCITKFWMIHTTISVRLYRSSFAIIEDQVSAFSCTHYIHRYRRCIMSLFTNISILVSQGRIYREVLWYTFELRSILEPYSRGVCTCDSNGPFIRPKRDEVTVVTNIKRAQCACIMSIHLNRGWGWGCLSMCSFS